MLAGNLGVTRRREPPLALTTIEGCFFLFLFFSNPSDSVKVSKVFSAFCLGLKRIDFAFKHGMLAKGNLFSCHFSALHVRF